MSARLPLPQRFQHPRAELWLAFFGRPSGPLGWLGGHVMPFVSGRLNDMMATELDPRPDDAVLDVGCGSGGFLEHVAPQVLSVAGLDASPIQVGMARQRLRARIDDGTAEIVQGDAEALPWPDGRFGAVASLNCLKFVADPGRALAEMHRVLRPGGRVAILVDAEVPQERSGVVDAFGQRQWSEGDLTLLMAEAGFVDVRVTQLPAAYYGLRLVRAETPR